MLKLLKLTLLVTTVTFVNIICSGCCDAKPNHDIPELKQLDSGPALAEFKKCDQDEFEGGLKPEPVPKRPCDKLGHIQLVAEKSPIEQPLQPEPVNGPLEITTDRDLLINGSLFIPHGFDFTERATYGEVDMAKSEKYGSVIVTSLKGQGVDAIYNWDHITSIGKTNVRRYPTSVKMTNGLRYLTEFTMEQWTEILLPKYGLFIDGEYIEPDLDTPPPPRPCPNAKPFGPPGCPYKQSKGPPVVIEETPKEKVKCKDGKCGRGYNHRPKKRILFR